MQQTLVTFIAQVKQGQVDRLRCLLRKFAPNPIPFEQIPSLHFSSMLLTEGPEPVFFIWENNFDGPTEAYIDLTVRVAEARLRLLYKHCATYDAGKTMYDYLAECVKPARIHHIGAPGLSARRVKAEHALCEALGGFLNEMEIGSVRSGHEAQEYLQRRVASEPLLRWAETPEGRLGCLDLVWRWVSLFLVGAALFLLVVAVLPLVVIFIAFLRCTETREKAGPFRDPKKLEELLRHEDHGPQNHLASVTTVKPGWFRPRFLKVLLRLSSFVARVQTRGKLGGIPGIFFAHWSLFDDDRKLLFVTNYTGGWNSYLDDFIDYCSWGLTPIWSNTKGFPKTRLLFAGGSRNRTAFKQFVRTSQLESLIWYSAYPNLTLQNVNRNSSIRDGLFQRFSTPELSRWLRLF